MSMSIGYMCDETFRFAELLKNNLYNLDIGLLVVAAKVVDFSDFTLFQNCKDSITMVLLIEPVTNIKSLSIYRKRLVMCGIMDHERNQLLRELVRTIVVGATANGNR